MGDLLTGVLGLLIAVAMPFVVLEGHAAVQSLQGLRRAAPGFETSTPGNNLAGRPTASGSYERRHAGPVGGTPGPGPDLSRQVVHRRLPMVRGGFRYVASHLTEDDAKLIANGMNALAVYGATLLDELTASVEPGNLTA